jgi:hypothetical protein
MDADTWVPAACTLPTADQPLRLADFDALFAEVVRRVERPEPGVARLVLDPTPAVAARTADLVAREAECCSFFTFTLTITADTLLLDVAVPPAHHAILDALATLANAAAGR